jgi:chromosome partitioning protein
MFVTVCSFKGGVGKTTTAVHLAAYLQTKGPTLLIDGDPNRSASKWTTRGELPFKIVDERQGPRYARDYEHVVIDTEARPNEEDLRALTIIPPKPSKDGEDARQMLKKRGLPVFKGEIHRLAAFQKASLAGIPVYDVKDPRAKLAWADYESVGKEILR